MFLRLRRSSFYTDMDCEPATTAAPVYGLCATTFNPPCWRGMAALRWPPPGAALAPRTDSWANTPDHALRRSPRCIASEPRSWTRTWPGTAKVKPRPSMACPAWLTGHPCALQAGIDLPGPASREGARRPLGERPTVAVGVGLVKPAEEQVTRGWLFLGPGMSPSRGTASGVLLARRAWQFERPAHGSRPAGTPACISRRPDRPSFPCPASPRA